MSLIALPRNYRFVVENKSGQTIAINDVDLTIRRAKSDSNGALVYESTSTTLTNAASIANAAFGVIGAVQANDTDLFLSGDGIFSVTSGGVAPNGDVILYIQESPDGGTTFPDDDRTQKVLAVMNITVASATEKTEFAF